LIYLRQVLTMQLRLALNLLCSSYRPLPSDPSASTFCVLGLQACNTTPSTTGPISSKHSSSYD
jgi:hypothetical protein